jgi:hypothetical protein
LVCHVHSSLERSCHDFTRECALNEIPLRLFKIQLILQELPRSFFVSLLCSAAKARAPSDRRAQRSGQLLLYTTILYFERVVSTEAMLVTDIIAVKYRASNPPIARLLAFDPWNDKPIAMKCLATVLHKPGDFLWGITIPRSWMM